MILEKTLERNIEVSKAVVLWNYFDHEHLDVVHGGYKEAHVLFEKGNYFVNIYKVKIPFIPFFYFKFPVFGFMEDEDTYVNYSFQFGIDSKLTVSVNEIKKDYCKIKMNYKFNLVGLRIIFYPLLKLMVSRWNEKVWMEDMPVKTRRQMVLRMGFKDFYGLPDKIEDRFFEDTLKVELPIKRPRHSTRDRHPLKLSNNE